MTRRRRGSWRRCADAPESGAAAHAIPAREGQPWWQGSWQALGGLFNLLAALASRWPRHGS